MFIFNLLRSQCLFCVFALFLVGCNQAEEAKQPSRKSQPENSNQVQRDSNTERFFEIILAKYPNAYNPLGSGISFSESLSEEEYSSKSSFLMFDSLKNGADKYLIEVTPDTLAKYSDIHIYMGRNSCHWELACDCWWMGFLHDNEADFINNSSDKGYDGDFIKALGSINLKNRQDKEKLCLVVIHSLITSHSPELIWYGVDNESCSWHGDKLRITSHYSESCTDYESNETREIQHESHIIEFTFRNDHIVQIIPVM